jgi:hypothetical protein
LPGDGEPHLCIGPVTITMGADGIPFAERFVLPLLNLDKAWYEASRRYGPYNHHPDRCEDWNLESGGDSDLGEPLVAPFAGIVINAADYGGNWGLILRILGRTPEGELVTWMGAHLDEIYVKPGDIVQAGDVVGTIGNNHGMYAAHLHEQICVGEVPAPWTFGGDRRFDFRQPSGFYAVHGVDADLLTRVTRFDGE